MMLFADASALVANVAVVAADKTVVRETAVKALADVRYVVLAAEHAAFALALRKARAARVDVLFTDIHMPVAFDGLELARLGRPH